MQAIDLVTEKKNRGESGFTLMELLVVCVLIAVMLTFAVPTLRDTVFSDPLKNSSRKTIGFIGGVREFSARHRQAHLLYVSPTENKIWFTVDDVDQVDVQEDQPENKVNKELLIPEGVSIAEVWVGGEGSVLEEQIAIWISPQGYMNQTKIQLRDDNGQSLTVTFHTFLDSPSLSDDFLIPE